MLKAIFSAVASALRSIGRIVGRIAAAPFRLVDRVLFGGDGGGALPEIPEVRPYDESEPHDVADNYAFYLEIANMIMSWAADSIIANAPAPLPPRLPIELREWLPGLTRAECGALINADENGVSAHIQRMFPLPGVRPVQRLTPMRGWPEEPSLEFAEEDSPSFVSHEALYGPTA